MKKGMGWILALGLFCLLPCAVALAPGWDSLKNCRFLEGSHSDGDSVEAVYKGQRYVFRLYFVDTIEKNPQSRSRRAGQAKYFNLRGDEVEGKALQAAYAASERTEALLQKPFTVFTRWEKVDPRGDNPSYRAFVETAQGDDLGENLVANGLAIIRNGRLSTEDHPNGRIIDEILRDLRRAETTAHQKGLGAWSAVGPGEGKSMPPSGPIAAGERNTLQGLAGHNARVQGRVSRVSSLPDGRITFVNFDGNGREDFVAIVRSGSLAEFKKDFPEGLGVALVGKNVIIEGLITLYRDTPQIEIERASQITVLPARERR